MEKCSPAGTIAVFHVVEARDKNKTRVSCTTKSSHGLSSFVYMEYIFKYRFFYFRSSVAIRLSTIVGASKEKEKKHHCFKIV